MTIQDMRSSWSSCRLLLFPLLSPSLLPNPICCQNPWIPDEAPRSHGVFQFPDQHARAEPGYSLGPQPAQVRECAMGRGASKPDPSKALWVVGGRARGKPPQGGKQPHSQERGASPGEEGGIQTGWEPVEWWWFSKSKLLFRTGRRTSTWRPTLVLEVLEPVAVVECSLESQQGGAASRRPKRGQSWEGL